MNKIYEYVGSSGIPPRCNICSHHQFLLESVLEGSGWHLIHTNLAVLMEWQSLKPKEVIHRWNDKVFELRKKPHCLLHYKEIKI